MSTQRGLSQFLFARCARSWASTARPAASRFGVAVFAVLALTSLGACSSSDSNGRLDGAVRDGAVGDGAPHDSVAHDGVAHDGVAHDGNVWDVHDGSLWDGPPHDGAALGPAAVPLGKAGTFVILAKSGIDTIPSSIITGNIGASPIDSTAVTGFSLSVDASNTFATSAQVTGKIYAADYAAPTPSELTTAISDMETAYTDAAGRTLPDHTELGAGQIGGLVLTPGLYKWGTGLMISTNVTLLGGPKDVWIFQVAGDFTLANGIRIKLAGGALAKNIFWQTFGQFKVGTTAHFEGIALCQTAIVLGTGATVNGRLLAQTAVTLDQSTVTSPSL